MIGVKPTGNHFLPQSSLSWTEWQDDHSIAVVFTWLGTLIPRNFQAKVLQTEAITIFNLRLSIPEIPTSCPLRAKLALPTPSLDTEYSPKAYILKA
jgi:hypothetical protein